MECLICNSNDWENVDRYRLKKEGMGLCKKCGFITYPEKWKSEKDIEDYYRNQYRQAPNAGNFHTGLRKVHYHNAFLGSVFKEWKDKKFESPVVCDVGAATGIMLEFCFKRTFPKSDLNGTELTTSFRRNAFQEYGISLDEKINKKKKYDLISSYKVAEHQLNADQELSAYRSLLKDGGYLYISVPQWFVRMVNFGLPNFDVEYYYSPDHINVWTKKHFEGLLKKIGFKIVKEDHIMYDATYLCQKCEPQEDISDHYEDPNKIKEIMDRYLRSFKAYSEARYKDAIDIYPNFPMCHIANYEKTKSTLHNEGLDFINNTVIKFAKESCPESIDILFLEADILMRYSEWRKSGKVFEKILKMSPNNCKALLGMANCLRFASDKEENEESKVKMRIEARDICRFILEISHQNRDEILSWVYDDNSNIPITENK